MQAKDVLKTALEVLSNELKKEPISPDRILALTEVIKAFNGANFLSRF